MSLPRILHEGLSPVVLVSVQHLSREIVYSSYFISINDWISCFRSLTDIVVSLVLLHRVEYDFLSHERDPTLCLFYVLSFRGLLSFLQTQVPKSCHCYFGCMIHTGSFNLLLTQRYQMVGSKHPILPCTSWPYKNGTTKWG